VARLHISPFQRFAALSLSLHAAAFAALEHRAAHKSPSFDALSRPLAGDTLDVDPPSFAPADNESPDPTTTPTPTPTSTPTPTPTPTRTRRASSGRESEVPMTVATPPAIFGAVGDRLAADLATTFTRAFPQAASADADWFSVPFGSAGRADVTLVIDDEGHLASRAIGGSPSPVLRQSIERTLVLLAQRAFTARGAVTKLRIAARVSRDDVHDGLHGDVFALSAGSFVGDFGAAFFALPPGRGPGRRVDVELRLMP
jgi:hypothetical protein